MLYEQDGLSRSGRRTIARGKQGSRTSAKNLKTGNSAIKGATVAEAKKKASNSRQSSNRRTPSLARRREANRTRTDSTGFFSANRAGVQRAATPGSATARRMARENRQSRTNALNRRSEFLNL